MSFDNLLVDRDADAAIAAVTGCRPSAIAAGPTDGSSRRASGSRIVK